MGVTDPNVYAATIIVFAALIHSGFSLGASMLSLLSGHSLSRKRSHARLLSLTGGFVLGSFAMILLLLLALTYAGLLVFAVGYPLFHLLLATGAVLSGIWVLFFYYRRGQDGAALWLPRSFARYLTERTAHTKSSSEAFVLGAASVIYELPITIWLLLIAAANLSFVYPSLQIPVAAGYSLVAIIGLLIVFFLIGGGHTGASLVRFRSQYKRFLQVLIGISMIVLGASLFWSDYYSVITAGGALW